jgi:hypothetical protein
LVDTGEFFRDMSAHDISPRQVCNKGNLAVELGLLRYAIVRRRRISHDV